MAADSPADANVVRLFRWPRKRRLTVLEDFALQILENELGNSDEEIARILCLGKEDIAAIFDAPGLKGIVRGDNSHRALSSDFTREIPDGIAIVEDEEDAPSDLGLEDDTLRDIDSLEKSHGSEVEWDELSRQQRKWVKDKGGRAIALPILALGKNLPILSKSLFKMSQANRKKRRPRRRAKTSPA